MFHREEDFSSDVSWIEEMLRSVAGARMEQAARQELAERIARYARSQHVSLSQAVIARIATHYEQDHRRVTALRADAVGVEWQAVLIEVTRCAMARFDLALDDAALAELSGHVLAALRHDLETYSFEVALDQWLALQTARYVSHLRRNR